MMDDISFEGMKVEGMTSQNRDWRAEFTTEVRQKVVQKIMENLSKNYQTQSSSNPDILNQLTRISVQFEDKVFRNSATKEMYISLIIKKMGAVGLKKTEASETAGTNSSGLGNTSNGNDAGQSSETNATEQFSQYFVDNNSVEQTMQPNIYAHFQTETSGSQSSDQYQLQQQEFQDQSLKDKVQNTSNSTFVIQPDIHNLQPHLRQQIVTSKTTQNPFSQPSSVSTHYRPATFAQSSNSLMFQQNQQLGRQHDASEQRKWSMPQQNIISTFQQTLGQQRKNSGMQLQQKQQPFIFNSKAQQSSSLAIQQAGVRASEQNVLKTTQPGQLNQILVPQKQNGLSQEGIHPRPQTSGSFHQQRSIVDQQKLFQPQRSFAGSSSASVEPKSSSQLTINAADGLDETYQKLQDFKHQYRSQVEPILRKLKFLHDKATDPEQVRKYKMQLLWMEKVMPIFSLQQHQIANISREKLGTIQDSIIKFVNYVRQKNAASVQQQAELSQPTSGQSQISQPPQSWNGELQFPPVNLTMSNGLVSSAPTPSMQSGVQNSRCNFFSPPPYSSGMDLEQRNGSIMFQQSARKTGYNVAAAPQSTNFSSSNIMNPFNSQLTHHIRLSQNLEQHMQKQIIKNKKEQMLIRNSQTGLTPATESAENMHQALIPTTTHHPYSSSPRKSQFSSAHIDQKTFPLASTPLTPTSACVSLAQVDDLTQTQNQSTASSTPGISASPLLEEFTSLSNTSDTIPPLQHLLRAVKSLSPEVLSAAVHDIDSVVNVIDKIAGGTAETHSKAAIGEDLASETRFHVLEKNFASQQLGIYEKDMEQQFNAMTWDTVGQPMDWISDSEPAATITKFNKLRIKPNNDLLDEIKRANYQLVETLVEVGSTEDDFILAEAREGTITKCTYTAVSLSDDLKSLIPMFPVLTLRLLVTADYPNTSPVVLDKLPVGLCEVPEDVQEKTKLRFSKALRNISEPMSLLKIAKAWDASARAELLEFVKPFGGGCFSSRNGEWEDFSAA